MKEFRIRLEELCRKTIPIGFVGENLHSRIIIECKSAFDEYPAAVPALSVRPPKGDAYPGIAARDGDCVVWDVRNSDLAYPGDGEIQLTFTENGIIKKSYVGNTKTKRSIVPTGATPDPIADWLAEANAVLAAIPQTIEGIIDEITAEAEMLEPGESATASFDPETKVLHFGIPMPYVATIAETEEIISEYGGGSALIAEMEFYADGGFDAGFKTVEDASVLAEAFLSGTRVLLHIPAITGHGSYYPDNCEAYLEIVGYEPPYEDDTHTYSACFIVAGSGGVTYNSQLSAVHYFYRTSIDENGKLRVEIYVG